MNSNLDSRFCITIAAKEYINTSLRPQFAYRDSTAAFYVCICLVLIPLATRFVPGRLLLPGHMPPHVHLPICPLSGFAHGNCVLCCWDLFRARLHLRIRSHRDWSCHVLYTAWLSREKIIIKLYMAFLDALFCLCILARPSCGAWPVHWQIPLQASSTIFRSRRWLRASSWKLSTSVGVTLSYEQLYVQLIHPMPGLCGRKMVLLPGLTSLILNLVLALAWKRERTSCTKTLLLQLSLCILILGQAIRLFGPRSMTPETRRSCNLLSVATSQDFLDCRRLLRLRRSDLRECYQMECCLHRECLCRRWVGGDLWAGSRMAGGVGLLLRGILKSCVLLQLKSVRSPARQCSQAFLQSSSFFNFRCSHTVVLPSHRSSLLLMVFAVVIFVTCATHENVLCNVVVYPLHLERTRHRLKCVSYMMSVCSASIRNNKFSTPAPNYAIFLQSPPRNIQLPLDSSRAKVALESSRFADMARATSVFSRPLTRTTRTRNTCQAIPFHACLM
eukprot:284817514_2